MLDVQVWGTYAAGIGAGGTIAAATIALGYYIYQSKEKKKAQARQIRARVITRYGWRN